MCQRVLLNCNCVRQLLFIWLWLCQSVLLTWLWLCQAAARIRLWLCQGVPSICLWLCQTVHTYIVIGVSDNSTYMVVIVSYSSRKIVCLYAWVLCLSGCGCDRRLHLPGWIAAPLPWLFLFSTVPVPSCTKIWQYTCLVLLLQLNLQFWVALYAFSDGEDGSTLSSFHSWLK